MQSSSNHASSNKVDSIQLLLIHHDGQEFRFVLTANSSYLAGSSDNCRIALTGNDVHPIHCRFWLDEDCQLRVQDWNTGDKTWLNGQPIEEAVLNSGDELKIGGNRIVVASSATTNTDEETQAATETTAVTESSVSEIDLVQELDPERQSSDATMSAYVYDLDLDDVNDSNSSTNGSATDEDFQSPGTGFESNAVADDEVEWLRMEVDQLRIELAERDAQFETNSNLDDAANCEFNEDPQTAKLVNRLEELLEELNSADCRVRSLEDLLQASDEATQAEQEERLQLESWVTEIEQRITQREAETAAEMSRMMQRLQDAQTQNRQAEAQLEQALESNGNAFSDSSNQFIKKLRVQIDVLRQRLEVAEREKEELRREDCEQTTELAAQKIQELEQKLLQQQVDLSRERADIARKRVQLERLKDEIEQNQKPNHDMNDGDSRVLAMRQHLRDIHEQEQLEREERKQRSLGGRISRLLNRVGS